MGFFFNRQNSHDDIQEDKPKQFSYQECKDAYIHFPLGKRLVNSLPRFALSSPRKIVIQNAPQEVVEQYEKTLKKYNIDGIVFDALTQARIYGMSSVVVVTDKEDDDYKPLLIGDILKHNVFFNVLDPLNFDIEISQDPSSPKFRKPSRLNFRGGYNKGNIDPKRGFVCFNGNPLYIEFEQSNFNFGGQSVFANMEELKEIWENLYRALDRIATKASSIIVTNEYKEIKNPFDIEVAKKASGMLQQMKQGMIAFLSKGQHAEFFNLNGASEISQMIAEVKQAIAIALDDTPLAILMDKELSNGLSEGREDMKAVVMTVNNYRKQHIDGLYQFLDSYLFYKAWDDDFVKEVMIKHAHLYPAGIGINQVRETWIRDFNFVWESVYPKTPDEETKEKDGLLQRAKTLSEIGGSAESVQNVINDGRVFETDVEIKEQTPNTFGSFED